ncbi:alpha/beta hydrolase [Isoptericola sp. 4D.3]|uniref:Alpha/beta hydrolase n=1 Tax=Isoptericola peretonis TaxID=2918523 RepID=A0ABT0J9B7_9MICO|nr:alpha/beta hydrolase [Isoptericola sp. 4D.3]
MPDPQAAPRPGAGAWREDVLGPDFQARTLPLPGGAEAVLVRHVPSTPGDTGSPAARTAVLYVHGFADYFFHPHLATAVAARGLAFYSVDLRGHGRAWDAHVSAGGDPNQVRDVAVYAQDLDAAAAAVRSAGHERLVVLGHSTGGLVAPLWASARPGRADALVLNSPWVQLNKPGPVRAAATALVEVLGVLAPRAIVNHLDDGYARALHRAQGGEWEFDPAWKPDEPFAVRAAWLRSVLRSQRRLARGLRLDVPVLVLTSDRSTADQHLTTDTVLDVAHMRERAPRLGGDVTVRTITGGAHDLALSPRPARDAYLTAVLDWIEALP